MKQIFSVNHSFSTIWACASKSDIFSIKGAGQVLTSDNYENFASTKTMLWKKKRICDFLALAMKFIMTFQQHFSRKITSHPYINTARQLKNKRCNSESHKQ